MLVETGTATFVDVSAEAGINDHAASIAANFLDYDRDGRFDLVVGHAFAPHLQAYRPPRPFSIFRLEVGRSEEHTSELQSRPHLVCRLLLEKKKRAQQL